MKSQTILRHCLGYCVGFAVFLAGIPCGLWTIAAKLDRQLPVELISDVRVRLGLSLVLGLLGIVFVVWSNLYLFLVGRGGPADGFGVALSPRSRVLVTTGPYRHTRNPMVFGALTGYCAIAVYLNSLVALAAVAAFAVLATLNIRLLEERRLARDFGASFEQYRRDVPRFVPLPRGRSRR